MIFGKRVNKYYLRFAPLYIIGIIVLIALDYAQLIIPKIYRMVLFAINSGFIDEAKTTPFTLDILLNDVCLPMLIIVLVMVAGRFLWRVCFFGAGIKTEENLRRELFDHARLLSQEYYSKEKVGGLMSLFTNDLSVVEESMGWGVMMVFDALFLGAMSVYNMIVVNPVLTLFCGIPLLFLMIAGIILNRYLQLKWEEREASFSAISDFAQESFSGLAVIKAFVKEAKELIAFKKLNEKNEKINVEYTKLSVAMRVAVELFVESVICVILGVGGYLVFKGDITGEYLVEFISYFYTIIWPVMAIAELVDMHSRGKASLNRITKLLEEKPAVSDREGAKDAGVLKGKIEFKNVRFSYPQGRREILKGISFTINAGENVGIIGKIGSGKTTIMDLITRTYNVPDKKIFLDDNDVNDLTIRSVRDNIAYVPQDNFLFSDTIANNVAFAADNVPIDRIKEAARLACVSDDIESFPQGYDTVLGERGVTVSGGQKQRISIARAIVKDAPILMLDDSVSAVDTETEKVILLNLKRTRKGKTTVVIAHRISTVENLDKIIFIDNGNILAFGSHEELVSSCKEYRNLVELQKLEEKGVE